MSGLDGAPLAAVLAASGLTGPRAVVLTRKVNLALSARLGVTAVTRLLAPGNADLATAGSTVVADLAGSLLPAFESVAGAARQTELVLPGRDTFAKLA